MRVSAGKLWNGCHSILDVSCRAYIQEGFRLHTYASHSIYYPNVFEMNVVWTFRHDYPYKMCFITGLARARSFEQWTACCHGIRDDLEWALTNYNIHVMPTLWEYYTLQAKPISTSILKHYVVVLVCRETVLVRMVYGIRHSITMITRKTALDAYHVLYAFHHQLEHHRHHR